MKVSIHSSLKAVGGHLRQIYVFTASFSFKAGDTPSSSSLTERVGRPGQNKYKSTCLVTFCSTLAIIVGGIPSQGVPILMKCFTSVNDASKYICMKILSNQQSHRSRVILKES